MIISIGCEMRLNDYLKFDKKSSFMKDKFHNRFLRGYGVNISV